MSLASLTNVDSVENVLVFVSDSLRYDFLPDSVRDRGVTARTISASTFTASSLPSMLTGRYPSNHRVWGFEDQLAERPQLFETAEEFGIDAPTIWTDLDPPDKPPLKIHHVTRGRTLADLDPPFVHVIHDKGGHAPYGHTFDEVDSVEDFFAHGASDVEGLQRDYDNGVRASVERFEDALESLEARDLLADTLVVFCSDHGEVLGEPEHGCPYGHGVPMVPEVVSVPTVFIGAGLPEGETYPHLLSGTDVAPTALGARDVGVPTNLDGVDHWNENPPEDRVLRSEIWHRPSVAGREIDAYVASGLWNDDGGVVHHRRSRTKRFAYAIYYHLLNGPNAPVTRRRTNPGRLLTLLGAHVPKTVTYGDPDIDRSREELAAFEPGEAVPTGGPDREQLRKLGYID